MRQVISGARARFTKAEGTGRRLLRDRRDRWNWFDHVFRAYRRYQDSRGNRLAASITCYAFLAFFPLVALAYALLGYLVGISEQARAFFVEAVYSLLPGMAEQLEVDAIVQSKTAAGLIGLAGLVLAGLGWVQAMRESLRDVFGKEPQPEGNFLILRFWDGAALVLLGVLLVLGMAVTTITNTASHTVLSWLGWDDVTGAGTVLRLLSLTMAIASNTLIFLVLYSRLSGTRAPWRTIYQGALIGAVGFEALKQLATLLLSSTTKNPVYASFAVVVGLMVWINIVSRFLLIVAAWTATRRAVLTAEARDGESAAQDDPEAAAKADPECGPDPEAGPEPERGTGARDETAEVTTRTRRPRTDPRPMSGSR
ncbi:YihY/virulence factor BrkB family protein [Actinomadura sp. 9N407]|uniref:YihY/virulence factor BrkB family protein n=1 Tax=Actinomadura sp. 9N407 TaxID=3375154 RepID=UPI00379AD380